MSPKDIVLAQKRDADDRVTWLLQTNHHEEALEAVKQFGKQLKKHTYRVGQVNCLGIRHKGNGYVHYNILRQSACALSHALLSTCARGLRINYS